MFETVIIIQVHNTDPSTYNVVNHYSMNSHTEITKIKIIHSYPQQLELYAVFSTIKAGQIIFIEFS